MYYVNPAAFTGVTVVPSALIKEHLKLASGAQLKVILAVCTMADEGFDAEKIASVTGLKAPEVADQLIYWQGKGLITDENALRQTAIVETDEAPVQSDTAPSSVEESNPVRKAPAEKPATQDLPKPVYPDKLSREEITSRVDESQDIRELLRAAQEHLGRTLGQNDNSSMILLHDYYGLKTEIIMMICEFARTHGKEGNMSYIFKMGTNWSKREIDTIERASNELERLENVDSLWDTFNKTTDYAFHKKPTEGQLKTVDKWVNEWKFSLNIIGRAFTEMTANGVKSSVSYMDRILAGWFNAGADTDEKIDAEKKKYEDKKLAGTQSAKRKGAQKDTAANSSFDLEKAQQAAATGTLTVKKRQKR